MWSKTENFSVILKVGRFVFKLFKRASFFFSDKLLLKAVGPYGNFRLLIFLNITHHRYPNLSCRIKKTRKKQIGYI